MAELNLKQITDKFNAEFVGDVRKLVFWYDADTIRYSKEFFADRASLLAIDLGIDEKDKPVLQHYIKFFGAKERTQKFYEFDDNGRYIFFFSLPLDFNVASTCIL